MSTSNHETKTAFWAMVSRDLLVQWRDHNEFIFRVAMLPLILIVVYGFMLPTVGLLPAEFPTHMFCGMIGMSMLITGIHGTAVPISMDFHNLREIEDRLLAPVSSRTVAYAKMTVGVLESFVGGLIVLPISLIFMGHAISIDLSPERLPLLVLVLLLTAFASAARDSLWGPSSNPPRLPPCSPVFSCLLFFWEASFIPGTS